MTRAPYNPFHALERLRPDVFLCRLRLPRGRAWWLPAETAIVLDDRLTCVEERVAVAHEIEHIIRDDIAVPHAFFAAKQESRAHRSASRKLIHLDDLVDALRVSREEQVIAHLLEVDVATLRLRLDRITDTEQDYVERCLEDVA